MSFHQIATNIKKSPITYLFFAAILILAPLISQFYFDDSHDTPFHVQSVIGLEQGSSNIIEIFNTKIFEYISYDYGYGEGIFYPQFPHQVAATILHFGKHFDMDVLTALKITNFLSLAFSGIFMYLLMSRITKHKTAAFLASLFYMTAPYHLGDIFIRDAFNESAFFVFIPLVLLALNYLLHGNYRKYLIAFVVGYVGMINTHLVMTLFFSVFLVIIALISYKDFFNYKAIKHLAIGVILVSLIVSPFLTTMLESKQHYDYAVFANSYMYTLERVNASRLSLMRYIVPNDNTNVVPYNLNLFTLVLAMLLVLNYRKVSNRQNSFPIVYSITIVSISIFLASDFVSWQYFPKIMQNIQFPWRLETFIVFGICVLAGIALDYYSQHLNTALIALCILSCIANVAFVQARQDYRKYDIAAVNMEYPDYYPAVLLNEPDYLPSRAHEVLITEGSGQIYDYRDNGSHGLSFDVRTVSDSTKLELPRLYYLGYQVQLTDGFGNIFQTDYTPSEHGLISIVINQDAHVDIKYTGTRLSNLSNVVSVTAIVAFISYNIYGYYSSRRQKVV